MTRSRLLLRVFSILLVLFGVLLVGLVLVGAAHEPNTAIPASERGRHQVVRGIPLRVVQRGAGRDVLLIHGSPGSIADWAPVIDSLAGSFRMTAFDRPGHGYSGDGGAYSFAYNAQMALGLIEAEGLEHVTVVGHSYGVGVALALALLAKQGTIGALVLVDGAYDRPPGAPDPLYSLLAVPVVGIGVATVLGPLIAPSRIRQGLRAQFPVHEPPATFVAAGTRTWAAPKATHAVAMEVLGARTALAEQSSRYTQIHMPVSILAQARHAFRRDAAERLHRAILGSSLQLLDDTGHYLQFDRTADVVAAIRSAAVAAQPR